MSGSAIGNKENKRSWKQRRLLRFTSFLHMGYWFNFHIIALLYLNVNSQDVKRLKNMFVVVRGFWLTKFTNQSPESHTTIHMRNSILYFTTEVHTKFTSCDKHNTAFNCLQEFPFYFLIWQNQESGEFDAANVCSCRPKGDRSATQRGKTRVETGDEPSFSCCSAEGSGK